MDTEASLSCDDSLRRLEDTLFQAQFYLRQAMRCQAGANRDAILRMTKETLRQGLTDPNPAKVIDL